MTIAGVSNKLKLSQSYVDVQRKCPDKRSGKMSVGLVLNCQVGGPSASPVDGRSRQVDVLPDRVSGNTQLFGDAPEGDTLQPGVVHRFPQGLLRGEASLGGAVSGLRGSTYS